MVTPRTSKPLYLRKRGFTRISDHRQRRDDLFLHVALRICCCWVEQLEEAFDDRVEVREESVALDSLTEVDQGCSCMSMYPGLRGQGGL